MLIVCVDFGSLTMRQGRGFIAVPVIIDLFVCYLKNISPSTLLWIQSSLSGEEATLTNSQCHPRGSTEEVCMGRCTSCLGASYVDLS